MLGMTGYLTDFVKITKVQDHTTAGTSTVNSDALDMTGYDGVLFFTSFGTANANNTVNLAVSATSGGSYSDLTGTSVSSGASDEDVWIDATGGVADATKPFIRLTALRGTSSTLESIWAIQYKARALPIVNVLTGTIIGEKHNREVAGTA
jgi:hypothetical protein